MLLKMMLMIGMATAGLLLLMMGAPPAPAQQEASRQTFELNFTTQRPASSTGFSEAIDYVNPVEPSLKPFSVQRIVVGLATGTQVDTSVPEKCGAPDPALISQGAGACPPGSVVGGGEVDLDTGIVGPARIVRNDVTLLNDENQVIFLFEERERGTRVVSRARVSGASFTTEAPPIPGGPPDGFTAIDRVVLEIRPVSSGGESYITTPPSCLDAGSWANTATFTYRDGVTQSAQSNSTCQPRRGDDRLRCGGERPTIVGTREAEEIRGTPRGDVIAAGAGRDVIRGRGGRDTICSGRSADRARGGAGQDRVRGGPGRDRLFGNGRADRLNGGRGADRCNGGAARDLLRRCEAR